MKRKPSTPPLDAAVHERGPAPASLDDMLDDERERLKRMFPMPPARPPRRTARRAGVAVAGAVLMVIASALWLDPAWHEETHATAVGERREVLLRDGSRLTLDSATRLKMSWHVRSRNAELAQGRARFDVAHSAQRFSVAAGTTRVQVVGTRFDVDRHAGDAGDATQVTVWRGIVHVWHGRQPEGAPTVLQRGERLEVGRRSMGPPVAAVFDAQDDAAGGWTQGQLVFRDTPLREALTQLQRYRTGPIRLESGPASQLHVSGVFDTAEADRLLDLLPRILPVAVDRRPDGSVDVRSR